MSAAADKAGAVPQGRTGHIGRKAAQASYNADYENTEENITAYWMRLVMFVFVFALLAMITLEFIDKDKR